MKIKYLTIVIVLLYLSFGRLSAQNLPTNTTVPNGNGSGYIPAPANFNTYPNTAPSVYNYTRTYTPLEPLTSIPGFDNTQNLNVSVVTTYLDGLVQPLMVVNRNGSDSDIVTVFDNRQSFKETIYQPYATGFHSKFQNDAFTKQRSFYDVRYPHDDSFAYSVKHIYSDQGKPITKEYQPGKGFVGASRGTSSTIDYNTTADQILILTYDEINDRICQHNSYAAGELGMTKVEGVHGQVSIEYQNKSGKLICKKVLSGNVWLYTYYIYNEMGKLVCIAPPKAMERVFNVQLQCMGGYSDVCFIYRYDENGNVIQKNTPGRTDVERIVYNNRQLPCIVQTPLMKADNKFTFSIYDKLGRVVFTGIYSGSQSLSYFESVAKGITQVPNLASNMLEYWLIYGLQNYVYPTSSISDCELQTINYYDRYDIVPFTSPGFLDTFATVSSGLPPVPFMLTMGQLVASEVLVKNTFYQNNGVFQKQVYYYDELSQLIQTQTLTPYQATVPSYQTPLWDVTTTQYNFSGQPVNQVVFQNCIPGANKFTTTIQTRTHYGTKTGRLAHIEQKIDSGPWFAIASYAYDNLGRVKTKKLGGNAEVQNYTYNIRGQLIGINATQLYDTLVPSSANDSMSYWSSIHYETGFDNARYDGLITGYKWRSSSSPVMAYGYSYDNTSRMVKADYRDISYNGVSHAWNNMNRDFSVSNISFDNNGNILTMVQQGYDNNLQPGMIDNLEYGYDDGNRLKKVVDQGVPSPLHDFDNTTTATNDDYQYDADGNMTVDANKDITITYNYFDLPLQVLKQPSGVIENVYDGAGGLFQKTIVENNTSEIYTYIGPCVYKNDSLQYILHPEGRARYIPDSNTFEYDFFVKDHLGNVRAVKRSEITYDSVGYRAGFELISAAIEEATFDQIGTVRDLNPTLTPGDNYSGWLDGSDANKRIGAALLLHGMAGDQFNLRGYGYYEDTSTQNYAVHADGEDMLAALLGTLSGGTVPFAGEGTSPTHIVNSLVSTGNYDLYETLRQGVTNPNYPQAYLNILVYDEEMNLRPEFSEVIQLQGAAGSWHELAAAGSFSMPVNGYLLTYFSNASAVLVAVDNVYAIHYKGHLQEEQLYYPHGLLVELGGQQNTPLKNKYLYEGKKLQEELGLQLYDFHARQYDPQIGRFWGLDPADQYPSGYTGKGNDPANMVDPSGMWASYTDGQGGYWQHKSAAMHQYWRDYYEIDDQERARYAASAKQHKEEFESFLQSTQKGNDMEAMIARANGGWTPKSYVPIAAQSTGKPTEKGKVPGINSDGSTNTGSWVAKLFKSLGFDFISESVSKVIPGADLDNMKAENNSSTEGLWASKEESDPYLHGPSDPGGEDKRGNAENASIVTGAASTALGIKNEMIDLAAKSTPVVDNVGLKIMTKGAGFGADVIGVGITGYTIMEDRRAGRPVSEKSVFDLSIGAAGFMRGGFILTPIQWSVEKGMEWYFNKYLQPAPVKDYYKPLPQKNKL